MPGLNPPEHDFGGERVGFEQGEPPSGGGITGEQADSLLAMRRSERVAAVFDFDAWDYEADVLDSPYRRIVWVCGRQVGKTETAGVIPADWVLTHPGEDALIAAEYQETADELFARTKQHFANVGEPGTVGIEKPNTKTYTMDTGGRVLSRTLGGGAEGNPQRGKLPSCVVAEEAALIKRNVYDRVLRPMFATHEDYLLLLISTPRGKSGYLWDKWNDAPESDTWGRYRSKTGDSPLVTDEWLEGERAEVDDLTWRQEYLGRFVETGDEYLPESLVEPQQVSHGIERETDAAVLAVDPAGKGADRSVYASIDLNGNVFDLRSRETETVPESVGRIKALNNENAYSLIYVEENGLGTGVLDYSALELSRVEGWTTSQKSRQDMYRNLKTVFEQGNVTLPDGDDDARRMFNQLTSLTHGFSPNGILQVEHPPGGHDDYPDALAIGFAAVRDHTRSGDRQITRTRENPPGSHRRNLKKTR